MDLRLILMGFIVGIGKIIPGVSGAMLAMFMGIYEDLIKAITCFFEDKKKHLRLLVNFGIGLFIAISFFSQFILFLLKNYYDITIYFILGLIFGTILKFRKKIQIHGKEYILFFLSFGLVFLISFISNNNVYLYQQSFWDQIYVLFLGSIDAFTSIVPGISGTALFMMLGSYEFVLSVLGSFASFLFVLYMIGVVIGVILTCFLMKLLFHKKHKETNAVIFGFSLASLFILFLNVSDHISLFFLFLFTIGTLGGYLLDR